MTEAAHRDQLLAALGEAGVPLAARVELEETRGSVKDILEEALASFSLNRRGLEWTAVGLALYLPPQTSWRNSMGKVTSFDDLTVHLMDGAPGDGTCLGQHRMYSLVVLLQADDQTGILSAGVRRASLEWLSTASRMLADSQLSDGSWSGRWVQGRSSTPGKPDTLEVRLRMTTHVLEWWSLAPEEVLPDSQVIERAVDWLASFVQTSQESEVQASYTSLSHGARALRLWMAGKCARSHHSRALTRNPPQYDPTNERDRGLVADLLANCRSFRPLLVCR